MDKKELLVPQKKTESVEIDLGRIFQGVLKRVWIVALVSVLCAALALTGSLYFLQPQYQASAKFYVNNNSKPSGLSPTLTYADITAAKSLVETYLVILNTRESIDKVIEYAEVDLSYGEVKNMISASGINETEVFQVVVTGTDPEVAEKVANAITKVLPERIAATVEGTSAKVVDRVPAGRSGPNYTQNAIIGLLFGLILSAGAAAIVEILDTTIKSGEDVENLCAYPVLATVPEMGANGKSSHKYKNNQDSRSDELLGEKVNFAATEAYKLLRTKLQYSFSDDKKCHVFMVSSAMAGEGKSLTSVNIAYNMAQLGKRVLLIDCDLRQPTLAEKLQMSKNPGLADYLAGCAELNEVIRQGNPNTIGSGVDVMVAGNNPPNPIELLSSDKMARMLEGLRSLYEYVILDLPPVGEVSDAMVASRLVDGAILVARQNYCNRNAFKDTVAQLEFIDTKILGVVINCAATPGNGYGYNYKYSRYSQYYRKRASNADGQKTEAK